MIFDPPPRSRRKVVARILWPALVAIAVIIAVVVSSAGEETRAELGYLEEIRAQTDDLAKSGLSLADVMSRLDTINRDEFTTVLDSVAADLDVAQAFLAEDPPVRTLIPVSSLYRQAVQAWDTGVGGLSVAILQAADDLDDGTVFNAAADALGELRTGDALYRDLKVEFQRDETPEPVSPLIDVRMRPTDAGLVSQAVSYVNEARSSTNSLGLRPSLKVSQVLSDPIWRVNVDRQVVVPATETIVFSTVITNSGNVVSKPELVTMTFGGGSEPIVEEAQVPPLQPNRQITIEFQEVQVLPDTLYEIKVELKLSNPDSDMTDNSRTVQFTVNSS